MATEYTQNQVELKIKLQEKMLSHFVWQSCVNCSNFSENTELCDKFKAKPPAYIIVSGCKDYDSDVPF